MGFHWTPCRGGAVGTAALIGLILCLICGAELPIVIRDLLPAFEWGCGILGGCMILSAILYPVMMHFLMPQTILIQGNRHPGFPEAQNVPSGSDPKVGRTYTVPLLFRPADEGEEGTSGKFDIPSWRN